MISWMIKNNMDKKGLFCLMLFFLLFLPFMASSFALNDRSSQQETQFELDEKTSLLKFLGLIPSSESIDYVQHKTQFQVHRLLTEQRHPKTWNLSDRVEQNAEAGLQMLFSVDEDIVRKLSSLGKEKDMLEQLVRSIEEAILHGQKIYIFGSGSSGCLAKQIEGAIWRSFWTAVRQRKKIWSKISPSVGDSIGERLIGEIPGGDPSLMNYSEELEDLSILGPLHLRDHKIERGDIVLCITESGETRSITRAILSALDQWKSKNLYDVEQASKKLYFIYNNADETLRNFEQSRKILDEPGISKINLSTGPQAIAGSTGMQAATINSFVLGHIIQMAIDRSLRRSLSKKEMEKLGFREPLSVQDLAEGFSDILKQVKKKIPALAKWADIEADTYKNGHHSTFLAQKALLTVLADIRERSKIFGIRSLDTVSEQERKCWAQIWTPSNDPEEAWTSLLGRPFHRIASSFAKSQPPNETDGESHGQNVIDRLIKSGGDFQSQYDLSFADFNIQYRGHEEGDMGVLIGAGSETFQLKENKSDSLRFLGLLQEKKVPVGLLFITGRREKNLEKFIRKIPGLDPKGKDVQVIISTDTRKDSLGMNQLIALKIILNAHSAALMARMGKIVGNTPAALSLHNLKNIDRATYLVRSHVNDVLCRPQWVKLYGVHKPISFGEANAVLYEALAFMENRGGRIDGEFEVALAVVRILESLRLNKPISISQAFDIVQGKGINYYLKNVGP
jgi:N-acetylmuramic acid 6-phosphate etherase